MKTKLTQAVYRCKKGCGCKMCNLDYFDAGRYAG
jgi:hypothetical protein